MTSKPGRNDPCPCGSGKKFKHCCQGKTALTPARPSAPPETELALLGNLFNAGRLAEVETQAGLLVERYPNCVPAWKLLGASRHLQGKDGLTALRKAVELQPADAMAHSNLGNALKDRGQLAEAVSAYRRALQLKSDLPGIHYNLGLALFDLGQAENAIASYRQALALKPDYAEAHSDLGNAFKYLGQLEHALTSFRRALELRPDLIMAHNNLLFTLHYTSQYSASYYLDRAREFGRLLSGRALGRFTDWRHVHDPARLRVGIVTGDLCNHPVGYFLEGLITHLDPDKIELIAYPTYAKEDDLTARIKPYFSGWRSLAALNDEAAARLIHADGIHILLDVSGHSRHNRLPIFAWKPAPIQVTWLALPGTTGVNEMDYVLGDSLSIPSEHENHFSETVWRLPDSYLCFSPPTSPTEVGALPARSTGQVTFGSFNNLSKMTDEAVALWSRILLSIPGSRLYLKTSQLKHEDIREQTRQRFASHGVGAERLLLSGTLGSMTEHLAEYNKVDIALDTFPYPGVTTSFDALWMGVPVLSLQGDRFMSLTAKTIAQHAGLADWVAVDTDDYLSKAASFASDLEQLAALRARLRQQALSSPLFDAPRFARNFEHALWAMWQKHLRGRQPTE
ncbi:MAG: tetratricopeptide repeat protein [Nitrosomonadales bacterium]|nr:tetratricopeptide repeat protein [Nitrosomonadales bacterium]